MSHPSPYGKEGSREADGDERDTRDRICNGKTLKKRNYLDGNEGEAKLMRMAGKRYHGYLGN